MYLNDQRHKLVQDLRTGRDKEETQSRDRPKTESTYGGRRAMAALIGPMVHTGARVDNAGREGEV